MLMPGKDNQDTNEVSQTFNFKYSIKDNWFVTTTNICDEIHILVIEGNGFTSKLISKPRHARVEASRDETSLIT